MRREGYIVEEVADYSNMSSSFDQVLRGSKRKKSRQGRYLHPEPTPSRITVNVLYVKAVRFGGYRFLL